MTAEFDSYHEGVESYLRDREALQHGTEEIEMLAAIADKETEVVGQLMNQNADTIADAMVAEEALNGIYKRKYLRNDSGSRNFCCCFSNRDAEGQASHEGSRRRSAV